MENVDEQMKAVIDKLEQYDVFVQRLEWNDPRIAQERPGRPNCFLHSLPDGRITIYVAGDVDQVLEKSSQLYTKFKSWLNDTNTLVLNLSDYANSIGKPLWMVSQSLIDALYGYVQEKSNGKQEDNPQ